MIGIAQDQRGVDVLELLRRNSLDRSLRPHRREDGSEKVTVRRGENPCAGTVGFGSDLELKHIGGLYDIRESEAGKPICSN